MTVRQGMFGRHLASQDGVTEWETGKTLEAESRQDEQIVADDR